MLTGRQLDHVIDETTASLEEIGIYGFKVYNPISLVTYNVGYEKMAARLVSHIRKVMVSGGKLPQPMRLAGVYVPFKQARHNLKNRLCEAQNHRCCYCGTHVQTENSCNYDYASFEHVVNRSHGGNHWFDNLVIACLACNNMRSHYDFVDAEEFYHQVITSPELRVQYIQERKRFN